MAEELVRKFRWFWAWQDQQEEAWLEEMSQQGLHLKSVGILALYYFESGCQQDYVYRLDFSSSYRDRENYMQLFKDAGWEHIGNIGSGNTSAKGEFQAKCWKSTPTTNPIRKNTCEC